jgi:hypothetical protein
MNDHVPGLPRRIRAPEGELELELATWRLELSFAVHEGKTGFEQEIRATGR